MSTKLYVGNIPFSTTSQDLQTLFSAHGPVVQVELVSDRFTGRSRGFAFVEMASAEDAQKAIGAIQGTVLDGRTITVSEARPREERPPRESGGGGGGGRDRGDRGDRGPRERR
ncbi:MAG TPA: RNA-binding protein [Opitutaceae bacterium]|nr:RNA-binding protein [Opitutaceae bacterium]